MKKIGIFVLIILGAYLLFVNITPGYFKWNCMGDISYSTEKTYCQLLPNPHKQNNLNNFLLSLNVFDLNKSSSDCLGSVMAIFCFPFLN